MISIMIIMILLTVEDKIPVKNLPEAGAEEGEGGKTATAPGAQL